MESVLLLMPFYFIHALSAVPDVANYTLRPWDEDEKSETLTTPSLRSLQSPQPQSQFAENGPSPNNPYGPGFNGPPQQIIGPNGPGPKNPFGLPYGVIPPQPQGPQGVSPFRYGQQPNAYYGPWQPSQGYPGSAPQGYPGSPPQGYPGAAPQGYPGAINPNSYYGWPGNRLQQFSPYTQPQLGMGGYPNAPFAQQQPGAFPIGAQGAQFGQPIMPNPYAPAYPYSQPYPNVGQQYGPSPMMGFFQGGSGPQPFDEERRRPENIGQNGQQQPIIAQNPILSLSGGKTLPLYPGLPVFPNGQDSFLNNRKGQI